MLNNFSKKYIVELEYLKDHHVFKDIEIANDNLHYVRKLSNGIEVHKVALTTFVSNLIST